MIASGPQAQLAALMGAEAATAMIQRFHDGLEEAVAAIDGGADPGPVGHRIGGIAGTLGFAALSAAWLSLQDDSSMWPPVRAMTLEALADWKAQSAES